MSGNSPENPGPRQPDGERHEHDCSEVQAALWRYVDRELSGREMAEMSEVLRSCEDCRRVHDERARELRICRVSLADVPFGGEGFVERFRQRFEDEGLEKVRLARRPSFLQRWFGGQRWSGLQGWSGGQGATAADRDRSNGSTSRREPDGSVHGAVHGGDDSRSADAFDGLVALPPTSPQRRRRLIAVAALLLLIPAIVGIGIYHQRGGNQSIGLYRVVQEDAGAPASGSVEIHESGSGGESRDAGSEGVFRSRTQFSVAEGSRLELSLGAHENAGEPVARIAIVGPAEFKTQGSTAEEFSGYLLSGTLHAQVSKRSQGESFEIRTLRHAIKVIGTEFTLEADGERTRLTVQHGQVAFGVWGGASGELYEEKVVSAGDMRTLPEELKVAPDLSSGRSSSQPETAATGTSTNAGTSSSRVDGAVGVGGKNDAESPGDSGTTRAGDGSGQPSGLLPVEKGPRLDSAELDKLDKPDDGKSD